MLLVVTVAWRSCRGHRAGHRILLFGVRIVAAVALLLTLLQPTLRERSVTRSPNAIAVLVDASRSMGLQAKGESSPFEQALHLLGRSKDRLAGWSQKRRVEFYTFGETLQAHSGLEGVKPQEERTDVARALEALGQRYAKGDLAGVVLVSDGDDNMRLAAGRVGFAEALVRKLGAPLHTVWVEGRSFRDAAVAEVFADEFAFVRNAVKVEAEIVARGLASKQVEVKLEEGGKVLARQVVQLTGGRDRYRVAFEFVPQRIGTRTFSVSIDPQPGEVVLDNNRQLFLVRVIRDRIRVLQVCGRPSWDERFLRRLLKRDPNIDLISFFILRTPASQALVPARELSLIPFPTAELFEHELGSFDLVLLQNFNYGPYGIGTYLPHLRRYVEQGGGLAMIGGDLSFASGGYAGTPVGDILPVVLRPGANARELVETSDFRMALTPAGRSHPILQLGQSARESRELLAKLPALSGVNRVVGAAPGTTVLATHPRLKGDDGAPLPVVATREVQRGRTLAITTDSLWHWAFVAVGEGLGRGAYDRFWRNAMRWLIRDPELRYLRVIADQRRVKLGKKVRLRIRAYKADYSAAKGVVVDCTVRPPSPAKPFTRQVTTNEQGDAVMSFPPSVAGPYVIVATARIEGRESREEQTVLVERQGRELRDPRPRSALLRLLASLSGGEYLGKARELPELSFRDPEVLRVNWRRDLQLWSQWWWFLTVVLLLALDWLVRRRLGHL